MKSRTRIHFNFGQYWDIRAVAQANIIHQLPLYDSAEDGMGQATATAWLQNHLAVLNAGVSKARDHRHIQLILQSVDPLLVLRWDFEQEMYSIDRYAPEFGCHTIIFYWSHRLGEGQAIRAILLASDMQRADTPQSYHKLKQEMVNQALKRKDEERAQAVLAAVDQLSTERIKNFLAVERALQLGEKIHVRGEDAKFLQRQYDKTKAGLIPGNDATALNPGMHPFKHRRMYRNGGYFSNEQRQDQIRDTIKVD